MRINRVAGRKAKLLLVFQAVVIAVILIALGVVTHHLHLSRTKAALSFSVLGFAFGWEMAVIVYRIQAVRRV